MVQKLNQQERLAELERMVRAGKIAQQMNVAESQNLDRQGQDSGSAARFFYFWPNATYTDYEIAQKGNGLYVPNGLLPANFLASGGTTWAYVVPNRRAKASPLVVSTGSYEIDSEIIPLTSGLNLQYPFSNLYANINMGITFGTFYLTAEQMLRSYSTPLILALTREAYFDISRYNIMRSFCMTFAFSLDTTARSGDRLIVPMPLTYNRLTLKVGTSAPVNPAVWRVYGGTELLHTQNLTLGMAEDYTFRFEDSPTQWELNFDGGGAGETCLVVVRMIIEEVLS